MMSDAPKSRPEVPEGQSRYVITRQKKANEKAYVGYKTIWEPFQKEVKYETPKSLIPVSWGTARPCKGARPNSSTDKVESGPDVPAGNFTPLHSVSRIDGISMGVLTR